MVFLRKYGEHKNSTAIKKKYEEKMYSNIHYIYMLCIKGRSWRASVHLWQHTTSNKNVYVNENYEPILANDSF